MQNASTCAKSFLELAPLIHSLTHFTDTLDSMREGHFRFLNKQKQALGNLKNTKRGKNHLAWRNFAEFKLRHMCRVRIASVLLHCTASSRLGRHRYIMDGTCRGNWMDFKSPAYLSFNKAGVRTGAARRDECSSQ